MKYSESLLILSTFVAVITISSAYVLQCFSDRENEYLCSLYALGRQRELLMIMVEELNSLVKN